jgi:hypothetical protein
MCGATLGWYGGAGLVLLACHPAREVEVRAPVAEQQARTPRAASSPHEPMAQVDIVYAGDEPPRGLWVHANIAYWLTYTQAWGFSLAKGWIHDTTCDPRPNTLHYSKSRGVIVAGVREPVYLCLYSGGVDVGVLIDGEPYIRYLERLERSYRPHPRGARAQHEYVGFDDEFGEIVLGPRHLVSVSTTLMRLIPLERPFHREMALDERFGVDAGFVRRAAFVGSSLYWTQSGPSRIYHLDLDTMTVGLFYAGDEPPESEKPDYVSKFGEKEFHWLGPYGLAVDATYVYWTEFRRHGGVFRKPRAGIAEAELVASAEFPTGLVLLEDDLLWLTRSGTLFRVSRQGGAPRALAVGPEGAGTLVSSADALYWTFRDGDASHATRGGVALVPRSRIEPKLDAHATGELNGLAPGHDG